MFSFGWSEIALIVVVIIIVVGPKEIPNLLKQLGSFSKTIKKTSREFKKSLKLPPFWLQECECGFQNWIRTSKRPLASFNFNQMWKARQL